MAKLGPVACDEERLDELAAVPKGTGERTNVGEQLRTDRDGHERLREHVVDVIGIRDGRIPPNKSTSASHTIGEYLLPGWLRKLRDRLPDARFRSTWSTLLAAWPR